MTSNLIAVCVLAAFSAALYTAIISRIAPRLGLVDRPDGHRKMQRKPIALGGGVAVLMALATVMAALLFTSNEWKTFLSEREPGVVSFFAASVIIVALGLIDDRFGLRGRYKLCGQMVSVAILMPYGLIIKHVALFGWEVELGLLSVPFTMAWMLGAINAINLLDGVDGLATTLGIILSVTMGILATMTGNPAIGMVAFVFAASLLGFLPFNMPPARIYLGDAGSMLIGLMLGTMAIHATLKGPGTVLLAVSLTVLAIPIFDSAAAILRRKLTGRSIYETDRGHLHHQLLDAFGSNLKVLACVGAACLVTSGAALLSVAAHNEWIAVASVVGVITVFIATGLFGRVEFLLLLSKVRSFVLGLILPSANATPGVRQNQVRLQGSRDWDLLWQTVTESAEKLSLARVRLDVNLPAMREGYNAVWECGHSEDAEQCWTVEVPLVLGKQTVGRLSVRGRCNGHPAYEDINRLLDMLEPFEEKLLAISQGPVHPSRRPLQPVP